MSSTVVLITGANRGLGRGLLEHYLSLTNHIVVAAVRSIEHEKSRSLAEISCGHGSRLILVKIDNTSVSDARDATVTLQHEFNIQHIDILIANAGICEHLLPLKDASLTEINRVLAVNTWSLLRLYQAALPMHLRASSPKLVYISSVLGSISSASKDTGHTGAYGLSKAAGNFCIQKIRSENDHLIAMAIDPGLVQTDMGNRGAKFAGMHEAPVTLGDSVQGIVYQVMYCIIAIPDSGHYSSYFNR
ncbi:unnamed protein product [Clonostachys rhizophaga]|uniref:NAD(P)-binding protein n=1 Tax=Clonostachys rhizophaga TaxID=160324 RepID=A0A9N9YKN0_9HYPO|nr:unnamed protein product [Clonostachys rhizophaga]